MFRCATQSKLLPLLAFIGVLCALFVCTAASPLKSVQSLTKIERQLLVKAAVEQIVLSSPDFTKGSRGASVGGIHASSMGLLDSARSFSTRSKVSGSLGGLLKAGTVEKNSLCDKEACKGPVVAIFLAPQCDKSNPELVVFKELLDREQLADEGKCVNTTLPREPETFDSWRCNATAGILGYSIFRGNRDPNVCSKTRPVETSEGGIGQCTNIRIGLLRVSFVLLCNAKDLEAMPTFSPINFPTWNYFLNSVAPREDNECGAGVSCGKTIYTTYYSDNACKKVFQHIYGVPKHTSDGHVVQVDQCYMGLATDPPTMNVQYYCNEHFAGRKLFSTGDCSGIPISHQGQLLNTCVDIGDGSFQTFCH